MCNQKSSGLSYCAVAREFNTSSSTAHRIFEQWRNTKTVEIQPRKGGRKKLTEAEIRYIRLLIKSNRQITWKALTGAMGGLVDRRTIRRALCDNYKRKWLSATRIPISKETAAARLHFARHWKGREDELTEIIFSDNSSVQNEGNGRRSWVFREPREKYH